MPDDNEEARKARARQLREEIASLKTPKHAPEDKPGEGKPTQESPRDFIDRAMQEREEGMDHSPKAVGPDADRRDCEK